MLSLKNIKDWLAKIERLGVSDDEAAHSSEDSLYRSFIEDISEREDILGRKAKLILTSRDMDFSRWCS